MEGDQLTERRINWYLRGPRGQGGYRGPNILELKRNEYRLLVDNLTGIYNEEGLKQIFEKYLSILRRKEIDLPLRVFYIDIDGFKGVNDKLGHDQGDRLLKKIAEGFKKNLRDEDILARLHGDEFAVLAFVGQDDENQIKSRLREVMEKLVISSDWLRGLKVGVSIGSSEIGEGFDKSGNLIRLKIEDTDPNFLLQSSLKVADARMYEEKKTKENAK